MKSIRLIALSAFVTISAFCAVLYSASCTKDACKGVTCLNGGTCSGGTCSCPTGWIGTNCQTRAFIGTWTGTDACSPSGSYNVTIKIDPSSTDTTKVIINNPGGFGTNNNITGTLSTDSKAITYTNQIVNSSTTPDTLSGTLTLTSNTQFGHSYTAREGAVFTCSGNYTKQ